MINKLVSFQFNFIADSECALFPEERQSILRNFTKEIYYVWVNGNPYSIPMASEIQYGLV